RYGEVGMLSPPGRAIELYIRRTDNPPFRSIFNFDPHAFSANSNKEVITIWRSGDAFPTREECKVIDMLD
ncbi:hypothetical protein V1477_019034, partial [Vespula maculifrons]